MATAPFTLFAVAAPGLEPLVAKELTQLGEQPRIDEGGGGVSWTGDARSMMRANLWLRSASRVLVRVAEFRAMAFFELEKRAKRIDWRAYLSGGATAEFRVSAKKSKLYHSDAIAERFAKATATQAKSGQLAARSSQLFVIRVHRDVCTISADSSGALLHMRGYRQAVAKAPLRETLAAALLVASEWTGKVALVDPLCGSGTIPIEAAMIARRIAPGRRRSFAFELWPTFDEQMWREMLAEADAQTQPRAPTPIAGSDRDAGAITSARANAERAGVQDDVVFETRALSANTPPANSGLIVTNPPYGKRVGGGHDVRNIYAQLGKLLRSEFENWGVVLLSPDDKLSAQLGFPLDTLFSSTNGGIRVRALASRAGSARFLHPR